MFRPIRLTKLKGWLIRLTSPLLPTPIDLSSLDMTKLNGLNGVPTQGDIAFNQLLFTIFKGAPRDWICQFIDELDGDIKHSERRWCRATSPLPPTLVSSNWVDIQWVLWFRFGGVQIINLPATGHEDTTEVKYLGQPMPIGVVKAVKVARYRNSDKPVGWRWKLYHRQTISDIYY